MDGRLLGQWPETAFWDIARYLALSVAILRRCGSSTMAQRWAARPKSYLELLSHLLCLPTNKVDGHKDWLARGYNLLF
jgi:hypothetical protein